MLLAPLVVMTYAATQVSAEPQLGPPPRGPGHGATDQAIAASLTPHLAAVLVAHPHGSIVLSEQDLTVLARQHNPVPGKLTNLAARVRDGRVVISGDESRLGHAVTLVGHLELAVSRTPVDRRVVAHLQRLEAGRMAVPEWVAVRIVPPSLTSIDVGALFGANDYLRTAVLSLDCVAAAPDGLVISVHRPQVPVDTAACGDI